MRIELVQLLGQECNIEANLESALTAIARCSPETDLIVFPETYLTGFPTADNIGHLAEPLDGTLLSSIQKACQGKNVSVAIGTAEACDGKFYNTTSLITPEGIAMAYRKTHLWASDKDVFHPGNRMMTCEWNVTVHQPRLD